MKIADSVLLNLFMCSNAMVQHWEVIIMEVEPNSEHDSVYQIIPNGLINTRPVNVQESSPGSTLPFT